MAFIGLPWPMKMTGMRRAGAAVRAVCACTWLARLCRVPSAAAAPMPCNQRRRLALAWKKSNCGEFIGLFLM